MTGFYLERIATTGSSRAAIDAGIIPANIPMIILIEIASINIPVEIKTGKLKTLLSTMVNR